MCHNGKHGQLHRNRVRSWLQRSRQAQDRRREQGPTSHEEHNMHLISPARLRSSPAGLAAILGPLRAEILATLWRMGRATTRDVYRQLDLPRRYAYSTIRTAMQR